MLLLLDVVRRLTDELSLVDVVSDYKKSFKWTGRNKSQIAISLRKERS